jgi:hypothetical protein
MAQAILERTDLSTLVIRAVRSESSAGSRVHRKATRVPKRSAGSA